MSSDRAPEGATLDVYERKMARLRKGKSVKCSICGRGLELFVGTRGEYAMVHVSNEDSQRCKNIAKGVPND